MSMLMMLLQDAPEGGDGSTSMIRVIAGVLALACVVIILMRRKKKASTDDWS